MAGWLPFDRRPPPVIPWTGTPICCGASVNALAGGELHGGSALVYGHANVFAGGELHGGSVSYAMAGGYSGGELHGGSVSLGTVLYFYGGELHGGSVSYAMAGGYSGGELHGGSALASVTSSTAGGELHGGSALASVTSSAAGGEEQGGTYSHIQPNLLVSGGELQGQTEPPSVTKVKYAVNPCSGVAISTRLKLTFTTRAGGCSCLPTVAHFVFDGTKWASVTSWASCSGTDLINWYISHQPGPSPAPGFYIWDTVAFRLIGGTCSPFSMNGTFSIAAGLYCGGGGSSFWTGVVVAE